MNVKRILAGLLASVLTISMLAGCGKTDSSKGDVKSDSPAQAENASLDPVAGTYPIVKDKINLKVFTTQIPSVQNYETNELTKYLEEKTNVHINWELTPTTVATTKINLMLASGADLPDIFLGVIKEGQLSLHGPQGTFLALNKYIDKYGKDFKRMEESFPDLKEMISYPDGNIYALPLLNVSENVQYNKRLWIYKPWLEKLNLKLPTTTEEYYQALKAIKEKDPNGNGKADEIPMVANKETNIPYGTMGFEVPIMNSFIYDNPSVNRMTLKNGIVRAAYATEEWKNGLLFFRKLFQEGLIDPISFSQDAKSMKALGDNKGDVIVGGSTGPNPNGITTLKDRLYQYDNIAPLKGPDGTQLNYFKPVTIDYGQGVITKACKYPEVAYRWMDSMYSEETTQRARLGVKEKDWKDAGPNDLAPDGKKALYVPILQWGTEQNSHWHQNSLNWTGPIAGRASTVAEMDVYLYGIVQKQKPFAPKEQIPDMLFSADDAQKINEICSVVVPYVEQIFAKICLDKNIDVEKEWNNYLGELKKMGVDNLVKIYQTNYDRKYKK